MYRDHTKVVQIGDRKIGGGNPVLIQSMTNTRDRRRGCHRTSDPGTGGCRMRDHPLRCSGYGGGGSADRNQKADPYPSGGRIFILITGLPSRAIEHGADKIRINPGNIGSTDRIRAVVNAAKERNIPIRVGVNSGSLEKELVEKYGGRLRRKVWWKAPWIK